MYKSGDSQNFMNATQGVNALVDGFGAGIEAAVQALQARTQERQHIDAKNEAASSATRALLCQRRRRDNAGTLALSLEQLLKFSFLRGATRVQS